MDSIIKELFDLTDNDEKYNNVVINIPRWNIDNKSNRNTTHQLSDYYKSVKSAFRLIRNLLTDVGVCFVITEDLTRPVITDLRESDSKVQGIRNSMLSIDRDAVSKSAERYVRDMLNISLTDDDIRIAPSDQIRVIHGNGAHLIVPLANYTPSICVYVTGRYPNFKVLGYVDYATIVNYTNDDYYKVPVEVLTPIEDLILESQFVNPFSAKPFEMIGMNWRMGILLQQTSFYYQETVVLPDNKYVIISTKRYDRSITNIDLENTCFIGIDRENFLMYDQL